MLGQASMAGAEGSDLELGDVVLKNGKKVKIDTEEELKSYREGRDEGRPLDEALDHLGEEHPGYNLPDASILDNQEDINKLMAGEMREEVYVLVRAVDEEGKETGGYTRVLLRREGTHYKKVDEPFSKKDSTHLQPKDRIFLVKE